MSSLPACSLIVISVLLLQAVAGFAPPPSSGDWVIKEDTSISNQPITLNGNLVVQRGGLLTLENVTLTMNCASNGQYIIDVQQGGELRMNRVTVTSASPGWHYKFQIYGKATITNSTIEEVWGSANWKDAGIYITSDDVALNFTTVRYARTTGITIHDADPAIRNCTICENGDRGILCYGESSAEIRDNIIRDNGRNGINQGEDSSARIFNNDIFNHTLTGINIYDRSSPNITGNKIHDIMSSNTTIGIQCWGDSDSDPMVRDNHIWNCTIGINNDEKSSAIIINNSISKCTEYGISVTGYATPKISWNRITDNCTYGIYNEQNCNSTIISNMITGCPFYGIWVLGDAKVDISNDNRFVNCSGSGIATMGRSTVNIDGNYFTGGHIGISNIDSGNVIINRNNLSNLSMCGVYNFNNPRVTLTNNIIERCIHGIFNDNFLSTNIYNNTLTKNKFGIYNNASGAHVIEKNLIKANTRAGIHNANEALPVIRNNTITKNEYAGINNTDSSGACIESNMISDNSWFGITNFNSSRPVIERNTISNHSGDGIFSCNESNVIIRNNTILKSSGNGISGDGRSRLTIEHNELLSNAVNIRMQGQYCNGTISFNNIRDGKTGIILEDTSPPICATDITDTSQQMETGLSLCRSSSVIRGVTVDLYKDKAIGCICEEGSRPRIESMTFSEKMTTCYKVTDDSHASLIDHTTNASRTEIRDTSSIDIYISFRACVTDSRQIPLEDARVLMNGIDCFNRTTDSNGLSSWVEIMGMTITNGNHGTEETRICYNVTIEKDGDLCSCGSIYLQGRETRHFIYDYPPCVSENPGFDVNEDEPTRRNLTEFLWDNDHDRALLKLALINGSELNDNVSLDVQTLEFKYSRPVQTDIIYLNASDGCRDIDFSVTVHVNPRNDPPRYNGSRTLEMFEGEVVIRNLGENLSDEDNDISELRIYSWDSLHPGCISIESLTLTFKYPSGIMNDNVEITVIDPEGATCSIILAITLKPVNEPPKIKQIPGLEFDEDKTCILDLKLYGTDDKDSPNQLTWRVENVPSKLLSVSIDDNGFMTITPYKDKSGEAQFNLIARDTGGRQTAVNVTVKILPVNDPPIFTGLPPFNAVAGKSVTIDVESWIYDPDIPKNKIRIDCNSSNVKITGTYITFEYPAGRPSGIDPIELVLTDGFDNTTYSNISVNITALKAEQWWITRYANEIFILVPFALLAGAVAILAFRRYKYGWYDVKRAFLVYQDGRMLAHAGEKADSDDEMLVSSMLTAVQQFIEEAMKKDKAGAIKEFQYEDMKIAVEKGRWLFLAAILKGYTTESLRRQMKNIVGGIETRYEKELKRWDGRMTRQPLIEESVAELNKLAGKRTGK